MIKLHYASFIFLLPLGCPLCFRCCRCACRQAGNAATPRTARTRPMSLGSPSPRTAPPAGAFRFSPHLVHLGALQCHCNATAMPLQCHCNAFCTAFNTQSVDVWACMLHLSFHAGEIEEVDYERKHWLFLA